MTEWHIISNKVIKYDDNICQRCQEIFKNAQLTVHHIVPRAEGGTNDYSNLITLCNPCHDWVEDHVHLLHTRLLIVNSFEDKIQPTKNEMPDDPNDWRQWVYGSKRNPILYPDGTQNAKNRGVREKLKLAEGYMYKASS